MPPNEINKKPGVEMLSQEQIAALKLFNEKADKLKRCSFTRLVFEHKSGVSFSATINEEIKIERAGPDEEAIDAFALTFRFFIQDNEKSSFRNLDSIYNEPPLSQLQKESFAKARRELNDYLDAFSIFTVNNERLSNRHILGSDSVTLPILFDNPLLQRECLTQGINGMHSKDFRLYSSQ